MRSAVALKTHTLPTPLRAVTTRGEHATVVAQFALTMLGGR